MSRREVEELNRWLESTRPPVQPSTWRDWCVDAAAMLYIAACGFVTIWAMWAAF